MISLGAQSSDADRSEPGQHPGETQNTRAGLRHIPERRIKMTTATEVTTIVVAIRTHHRRRRFAMKIQQKLDRALESFIRINMTNWHPDLPEKKRTEINDEVKTLIKQIRAGEISDNCDVVAVSDNARAPADLMRKTEEKILEELATGLPVYERFIKPTRGAGAGGLASIIGEAGDLSSYSTVSKLWKRLGYAPYDGLAGSTWKRETWRPRKLSTEEWIENPFKGERYAIMTQIVDSMLRAQLKSKTKTESGETEAAGPYGEIYVARYKHTKTSHPPKTDENTEGWSDGHRKSDAVRIVMKAFLKDLILAWRLDLPYDQEKDLSLKKETVAKKEVEHERLRQHSR
jgi:hypothetical protein